MREIFRPTFAALSAACLALPIAMLSTTDVLAQAKQPPASQAAPAAPQEQPQIKQIALTDKQVESAIAATKEMDPITAKLSDNAQPDPKVLAQLEGIAKKNGFSGYDDYNTVVDNISLTLSGFDPQTKKYVGPETVIKTQISQVEADKKMSAKDKKEALADLNEALKSPLPTVENKGNIDVVTKYYDKLAEEFGANDQE